MAPASIPVIWEYSDSKQQVMVAIPFLLIHSFLQARATEIVDSLEAAKITFLNLVQRMSSPSGEHAHAAPTR